MSETIEQMHERPPGGRCAVCRGPATRWHGETREAGTVAVGVCDLCGDALLRGRIGPGALIGLIQTARADRRPPLL